MAYVLAELAAGLVAGALSGVSGAGLQLAEGYLVSGLALLAGGLVLARRGRIPLRGVAAWPGARWIAGGVVAGLVLKGLGDLVLTAQDRLLGEPPPTNNPLALHPQAFHGAVALAAVVLAVTVVAPLGEELFFRGVIFGWLRSLWGLPAAALAAGFLFAAAHGSLGLLLPLTLVGFGLCCLYQQSGSLWPPVLAHAALNAVAVVAALGRV